MSECGCSSDCGSVHPDHIHTTTVRLSNGRRYQVFPDSAYILEMRLVTALPGPQLQVEVFTIEDPNDVTGNEDDDILWVMSSTATGTPPDTHVFKYPVYAEHGIYCQVFANGLEEVGYLTIRYVRRREYCCAFGHPPDYLQACWDTAPGREGTPLWEGFDPGEEDNDVWEESGDSGGSLGGSPLTVSSGEIITDSEFRNVTTNRTYT